MEMWRAFRFKGPPQWMASPRPTNAPNWFQLAPPNPAV